MKKILVLAIIIVAANFFLARSVEQKTSFYGGQDTLNVLQPAKFYSREDELVFTLLSRYHYKKFKLDDSLSYVILNRYLKTLDYNRSYFFASDVADFDKFKFQLDDDIKDGDLVPAYYIFNIFRDRMNDRLDYADSLLNKGFDFNKNEKYLVDRKNAPWIKDTASMDDLWRKKVKNDALNLILNGKDWTAAKKSLKARYNNLRRNLMQYKSEDVFQLFMNSFTEAIDPHTNYMSPITSDNFKIDMSRALEGIGAQLQQEDEYTKIADIIAGGPAFKSKKLHRGDKIIGVAQGKDSAMVDVIGWRLNDVVQRIRGPKGTVVRLQILPASEGVNGPPKEITLVRDKIKLEAQSAKDKILEIKNKGKDYKLGVITIPAFYSDFEAEQKGDKDYKSTTRDVRKLIKDLKEKDVKGIIIDLRNNGGGSLEEAIKLSGLFIKSGPIVQIRNTSGSIKVENDPDTSLVYGGPLAVLVNRFSASASEIFSAAIKDYGRGLIIGEETYGKGTVQNLIDLNRVMPSADGKMGQVKLTIAKFYRINGESTQKLGVMPNIQFPGMIDPQEYGESSEPSALPWDQIDSTKYHMFGKIDKYVPELIKEHLKRIKDDPEWAEYMSEVKDYRDAHKKKFVSLNESVRKKEHDELEAKRFKRENEIRKRLGLKLLKKGETPPVDNNPKEDPELDETGQIMANLIALS